MVRNSQQMSFGNEIKENEMGWACGTHGPETQYVVGICMEQINIKVHLGRDRRADDIKMNLNETEFENVC